MTYKKVWTVIDVPTEIGYTVIGLKPGLEAKGPAMIARLIVDKEDADLIAHAPDLLEAVEGLLFTISEMEVMYRCGSTVKGQEVKDRAVAAIAKARGE